MEKYLLIGGIKCNSIQLNDGVNTHAPTSPTPTVISPHNSVKVENLPITLILLVPYLL